MRPTLQARTHKHTHTHTHNTHRWNNPTFLEKMVSHFGLDPYGTCFKPEVWDPKSLPEGDTWPRCVQLARRGRGGGTPPAHGKGGGRW